jgi:hypothetical protein
LGNPTNAFEISYAIYFVDPITASETLIGSAMRTPVNPAVGEYYAALMIPNNAQIGCYRIRWKFRETSSSPEEGVVQEFSVIGDQVALSSQFSICEMELLRKVRIMLGDNDPDRAYHFRPPEGEGEVGCFNQVFGFIWKDEELVELFEIALWKWNIFPPNTDCKYPTVDALCSGRPGYKAAILWGTLVQAAQMIAYRWVADEFGYSIGGISLDIEKSSKYMDLKRNAEEQFTKLTEAKLMTEKYVRGLAQPRFGRGVRSAFGPHVGRGVLSPRSFIVFCIGIGYPIWHEVLTHASYLPPLLT